MKIKYIINMRKQNKLILFILMLIVSPAKTVNKLYDPIIPGFYPDPSKCRVDDDYYIVN